MTLPQLPSLPRLPAPRVPALPRLRPLPVLGAIGSRAFRAGRSLPNSPLVDRLLRGRAWIGLLAVLLFGLVAINVSLLKLNAAAGRNADRVKTLRIQNDRLHAKVSRLVGGDRLERVAGRLGLVMPEPGSVRYLSVRPGDAEHAANAIRAGKRAPGDGPLPGSVPDAPTAGIAPVGAAPAAPVGGVTGATAPSPLTQQPQTQAVTPSPAPGTQAPPTQAPATTGTGAAGVPAGQTTPATAPPG